MENSKNFLQEKKEVLPFNLGDTQDLKPCCHETVRTLIEKNPLMMCQKCENLIKSFLDDSLYKRYLTFCRSRNRSTQESSFKHYKLVIFRNH